MLTQHLTYDGYRRLIGETDYTTATLSTNQSWSYDGNGNTLTSTDNRNVTTTYVNDALGRVLSQTTAGVTNREKFDAAGQTAGLIDGRGILEIMSYDSRGNEWTSERDRESLYDSRSLCFHPAAYAAWFA